MSPEKSIILAVSTFGTIYLCSTSLQLINEKKFTM